MSGPQVRDSRDDLSHRAVFAEPGRAETLPVGERPSGRVQPVTARAEGTRRIDPADSRSGRVLQVVG